MSYRLDNLIESLRSTYDSFRDDLDCLLVSNARRYDRNPFLLVLDGFGTYVFISYAQEFMNIIM